MISYMTVTKCHISITYHMILSHIIENIKEDSKTITLYYIFFRIDVKIIDGGLYFIFSFHFILLYFSFSFSFSIFRTTWVRVYQSRCHISHKLMA